MSRSATHHNQVYFETWDNHLVEVDEGMFDILEELKRLGVKTQYSCQGQKPFDAYVLADRLSFRRVLWRVYRRRLLGLYSEEAAATVDSFRKGRHEHEFAIFRDHGCDEVFRVSVRRGKKLREQYAIEHSHSAAYGFRTSLRWPRSDGDKVLRLLQET